MEFCGKCLAGQRTEWSPDRAGRRTRSGSGERVKERGSERVRECESERSERAGELRW